MSRAQVSAQKEASRQLLQARIDRGEISQSDVDIFKTAYVYMTAATITGMAMSIPVWIALGRKRPRPGLMTKVAATLFLGGSTTFLGFTVGGAAAAWEVNANMPDSARCVCNADFMSRRKGGLAPSCLSSWISDLIPGPGPGPCFVNVEKSESLNKS